jgi:hypothetical protein
MVLALIVNLVLESVVDGMWHCNGCRCSIFEPCPYGCSPCKYGCWVHIQIQDHTGTASATAYEETAEEILGPCLVCTKMQKVFKIFRHIVYAGTCMEY